MADDQMAPHLIKRQSVGKKRSDPDIFAVSHLQMILFEASSEVKHAARVKNMKYQNLNSMQIICPLAIESTSSWDAKHCSQLRKSLDDQHRKWLTQKK